MNRRDAENAGILFSIFSLRSLRLCGVILLVLRAAPAATVTKVTDRVHFIQGSGDEANAVVVASDDGVLLIDTPRESEAAGVVEALRKLSPKPVRWVVNTHFHSDHTASNRYFAERQAAVIVSKELGRLLDKGQKVEGSRRLEFGKQMRLFPGSLEVRMQAASHKAHTGGDVFVYVPAEKVLATGDLYSPRSFPSVDAMGGEGSALGAVEALKQAIDAVPLMKSAIPTPRPAPSAAPEEEKSLEETVTVIPGHGALSNLKEMKEAYEAALRVKAEVGRAVAAKRSRQSLLSSAALAPYSGYRNFEEFVFLLFEEMSARR
jgi:glyoxylase-like metal-dependent hydrolase (beta-lactamase superfamily II)